jgi:TPR repeat protein
MVDSSFEPEVEAMITEAEVKAAAGDVDSLYFLSMLHHDLAMRRYSWAHFETADSYLRAAAEKGHLEAINRLKDWHVLRYALGRRISRKDAA